MSKTNTVAIIGGGVAGLSAGGLLSRKGWQVKLFEANDKLGGCCTNTYIEVIETFSVQNGVSQKNM